MTQHSTQLETLQQQLQELKGKELSAQNAVQLQFIESLIDRAQQHRESVREILTKKAEKALQKLLTPPAREDEHQNTTSATAQSPLQALTELLTQEKPVTTEKSKGLAFDEFLRQQEEEMVQTLTEVIETPVVEEEENPFGELRSSRLFRQAQLQQFADDLVEQAIQQAPENPGPLNPQMLAIRSLTFMRDISPHYLNRFVSYIDTLFWLEQAEDSPSPKAREKSRKSKRS